jgi:hypothetical protein
VARITRVHQEQAGDPVYFQNQADKWKALPDLTAAQRAAVVGYEAALAQLRQVNSDVLATADQLTRTAIEAVLAKSDLELGLEALLRGLAVAAHRPPARTPCTIIPLPVSESGTNWRWCVKPQFGARMGSQMGPECHFGSRLTPLSGDTILPETSCATASIGDRHHRGAERRSCPGARSPWFAAKASVLR